MPKQTDKRIEEKIDEIFPKLEGNTTRTQRIEVLRQALQEQKQEILEKIKGMRKEVPLEGSQAPSLNYNLALEDIKQIIINYV